MWLWGSWATNDITILSGGGDPDRTVLENTAIKLNSQLSAANSFVGSFNNGDKKKFGRGAAPNVDPSATLNQRGPSGITRLEDTHVFGSNLVLSGQYSFVDGGFSLTAQGGAGPDNRADLFPGGEHNTDSAGFQTIIESGGNSPAKIAEQLQEFADYDIVALTEVHRNNFGRYRADGSTERGPLRRYIGGIT